MDTSTTERPWEAYLPDHVNLYYVDYNNNLNNSTELVAECVKKNSFEPLSEKIFDWWDFPEGEYLAEMQRNMENDDVEWDDDWQDDIIDKLLDLDKSTAEENLIRNTCSFNCYYDLGYHVDEPFGGSEEEHEEEINGICETLGVALDSPMRSKIEDLFFNACYGGRLRIYFPGEIKQLISHNGWESNSKDFSTIRFKGKFRVCIMDLCNGSGDFQDDVELDVDYHFKRDCLGFSELDHYGFEEVFGDDCMISHSETPELLHESSESNKEIDDAELKAIREKEEKYNATFAAGKCAIGDKDMNRHRDVEYINSIPCGWHCPHCGMFWID